MRSGKLELTVSSCNISKIAAELNLLPKQAAVCATFWVSCGSFLFCSNKKYIKFYFNIFIVKKKKKKKKKAKLG
jgi:hypothetical protein